MFVKTYKSFDIHIQFIPEDLALKDTIDDTAENIARLAAQIESGELIYFTSRISAHKNGIELSSEYLGACIYVNEQDFIENSGYFDDMVETAVISAKNAIRSLCD